MIDQPPEEPTEHLRHQQMVLLEVLTVYPATEQVFNRKISIWETAKLSPKFRFFRESIGANPFNQFFEPLELRYLNNLIHEKIKYLLQERLRNCIFSPI